MSNKEQNSFLYSGATFSSLISGTEERKWAWRRGFTAPVTPKWSGLQAPGLGRNYKADVKTY